MIGFTVLLFSSFFEIFINHGASMMPTFAEGDILLVDKFSYLIESPGYGDIAVITPQVDKNRPTYIKRIIALPGDTIDFQSGSVYIKILGKTEWNKIDEAYMSQANKGSTFLPAYLENESSQFLIPDNEFWLMGDNRNNSADSRSCFRNCIDPRSSHTITKKNIIGKVIFKF